MATINLPPIPMKKLAASIRIMEKTWEPKTFRRGFMKGQARQMRKETKGQYIRGKNPLGHLWKSNARETKYNGRWSKKYNVRPSGDILRPSHARLRDTGQGMRSWAITTLRYDKAVISPERRYDVDFAIMIYMVLHNTIAGWSPARLRRANKKLSDYMLHRARIRP